MSSKYYYDPGLSSYSELPMRTEHKIIAMATSASRAPWHAHAGATLNG